MSEENMQEKPQPETVSFLGSKPQRRSRRSMVLLFLLPGGVIIIAVLAFIAWQAFLQHSASTSTNPAGTSASASKKDNNSSAVPPGWNDPVLYWGTVRTQVAQGLHLSVAQVTTKLQAATPPNTPAPLSSSKGSDAPAPGAAMTTVAAQQGITTDQLRTIELNALQKGCAAMLAQGELTQAQVDQRTQVFAGWDQGTLNWYVIHGFTGQ